MHYKKAMIGEEEKCKSGSRMSNKGGMDDGTL